MTSGARAPSVRESWGGRAAGELCVECEGGRALGCESGVAGACAGLLGEGLRRGQGCLVGAALGLLAVGGDVADLGMSGMAYPAVGGSVVLVAVFVEVDVDVGVGGERDELVVEVEAEQRVLAGESLDPLRRLVGGENMVFFDAGREVADDLDDAGGVGRAKERLDLVGEGIELGEERAEVLIKRRCVGIAGRQSPDVANRPRWRALDARSPSRDLVGFGAELGRDVWQRDGLASDHEVGVLPDLHGGTVGECSPNPREKSVEAGARLPEAGK